MPKFKAGEVHNPLGRPPGSGYRQQIFNDLVLPHKESLIEKALSMAKEGDAQMLKLFLERILPAKSNDEQVFLNLSSEVTNESVTTMGKDIVCLLSSGKITPQQAQSLLCIVKLYQETIAMPELFEKMKHVEVILDRITTQPINSFNPQSMLDKDNKE